jgi:hypothetical protein
MKFECNEVVDLLIEYYRGRDSSQRLGQYLVNCMDGVVDDKLFYEEDSNKALGMFLDNYVRPPLKSTD